MDRHDPLLKKGQKLTEQQEKEDLVRRIGLRWKVKATGRGAPLQTVSDRRAVLLLKQGQKLTEQQEKGDLARRIGLRWKVRPLAEVCLLLLTGQAQLSCQLCC